MKKLLLTVEGAVSLSEQEILITPFVLSENKPEQHETSALLKFPYGTKRIVELEFAGPAYVTPPREGRENVYTCILKGINRDDVVEGTEVWVYDRFFIGSR